MTKATTKKILKQNHNMKIVVVKHTGDCPFIRLASEAAEIQGGDFGYVCDLLRLDEGGKARIDCVYVEQDKASMKIWTDENVMVTKR